MSLARIAAPVLTALALGVASPATHALTFNFANATQDAANSGNYGNAYSMSVSGISLKVSAFSTTAMPGGAAGVFETANVAYFGSSSGFGVRARSPESLTIGSPNHAVDNIGPTDILLLAFSQSVVLTDFWVGWEHTSVTDVSLVRWTGGGTTTPTIVGGTIASLIAGPWDLANHYANVNVGSYTSTGLALSQGSRWWIVSGVDSGWGPTTLSADDDAFKLLKVKTETPTPPQEVPEPGSLALLALGVGA
jgi:hypothetical protein